MNIKICDAIMGAGKTQAAIAYMNSHPDKRFIYITPFLTECDRIKESCPNLHFVSPSNKIPEYNFRKYLHTIALLEGGRNIVSTHNLFLKYTDKMSQLIKDQGYTLIIDEALNVFDSTKVSFEDVEILKGLGYVTQKGLTVYSTPEGEEYSGAMSSIVDLAKGGRLETVSDEDSNTAYLFVLFSEEVLNAFDEVIVLTYLFESSEMKYYFDIKHIAYENIYVAKTTGGRYILTESNTYAPEYTKSLSQKIHIFQDKKINSIGDKKNALSNAWFMGNNKFDMSTLKNNIYNYFRNYNKGVPANKRMWSSYKSQESKLRGKGYTKCFVPFNEKATNKYKDRTVLAYLVNVYMNPFTKRYLLCRGADVKEDEWALSTMVQWIWRSAIRDGEEINIYVPSSRMRHLLEDWIKDVEENYQRIYNTNTQEITE